MQKAHVLGRVNRGLQPERLFPQLQNGLGVTSKAGSIFCPGHPWLALSRNPRSVPLISSIPTTVTQSHGLPPPFPWDFSDGNKEPCPGDAAASWSTHLAGSLLLSARPAIPGSQLTLARQAQSLHGYWSPQTSEERSGHLQVTTICSALQ